MSNVHNDDGPAAPRSSWRGTARLLFATAALAFVCGLPGSLQITRNLLVSLL